MGKEPEVNPFLLRSTSLMAVGPYVLHQIVTIIPDLPDQGVEAGTSGAIVHFYEDRLACEVECACTCAEECDCGCTAPTCVTVQFNQIKPYEANPTRAAGTPAQESTETP
jgi:hypothetical protein